MAANNELLRENSSLPAADDGFDGFNGRAAFSSFQKDIS
jgi:hypothetical protein